MQLSAKQISRTFILSALLTTLVGLCFSPQAINAQTSNDSSDLLKAVNEYLREREAAWSRGDFEGFVSEFKGDYVIEKLNPLDDESITELTDRFQALYEKHPNKIGKLYFTKPEIVESLKGLQIISCPWRVAKEDGDMQGELMLGVRTTDEKWPLNSDLPGVGLQVLGEKPEFNFGWASVIPPLLAIFLAIITRRVLVSLFFGILVGCGMLGGVNGIMSLSDIGVWFVNTLNILCQDFLWKALVDEDHLRILVFVIFMGAMVGVIHRSGGMLGIVSVLSPLARTRVGGQVVTWVMGLIIFFDDYANTLLLGNTMRPVTDRLKISREKLAYLVDSTAAPVAGLALISTWVAMLISEVETGYDVIDSEENLAMNVNSFTLVAQSIPYRFYIIFAIVFVPMIGFFGRDFGPMLSAERRALRGQPATDEIDQLSEGEDVSIGKWYNAVVPILVLVGFTVFFLVTTGRQAAIEEGAELTVFNVISKGNSYIALVYASLLGLIAALLLPTWQKKLSGNELFSAAWQGVKTVLPAMAILWLAWTLSDLTTKENLGTQTYIANLLTLETQPEGWSDAFFAFWQNVISVRWLPTAVFLLSSFVAFATGSSWGTMGIMCPIVIHVTYSLTTLQLFGNEMGACPPDHPIMLCGIASVIAGSIFGDHCSPISDTTVLSSQASGCNHIAHVRTQMPYALFVGLFSILFGTLPVGYFAYYGTNLPLWAVLIAGSISMLVCLFIFGRRPEAATESN